MFSVILITDQQCGISGDSPNPCTAIPSIWKVCEQGHLLSMVIIPLCWPQLSVLSCNSVTSGSVSWWALYPLAYCHWLCSLVPPTVIASLLPWQQKIIPEAGDPHRIVGYCFILPRTYHQRICFDVAWCALDCNAGLPSQTLPPLACGTPRPAMHRNPFTGTDLLADGSFRLQLVMEMGDPFAACPLAYSYLPWVLFVVRPFGLFWRYQRSPWAKPCP